LHGPHVHLTVKVPVVKDFNFRKLTGQRNGKVGYCFNPIRCGSAGEWVRQSVLFVRAKLKNDVTRN